MTVGSGGLSLDETLAARGVTPELAIALDATVTAETLGLRTERTAAVPLSGSLPRISISFPGEPGAPAGPPAVSGDEGELEVVSLLGEGGMGSVYLARERALGREVAIKTTRAVAAPEVSAALCAEAVITGQLEHPGIVPVHQLARARDGRPVLVMKRVEGTSWRALLQDPGHDAWRTLRAGEGALDRRAFHLEVLRRVCEALAFAHRRGIVHRDVKPENVMVGEFGEVYLVDWGLAVRAGEPGRSEPLVGTPLYMAPEMVRGGPVDARTDVYLLGATLHEVLTGAPPHAGTTLQQVLIAALESEPKTYGPEVPADLAALCRRAMAPHPDARFADAGELRAALEEHGRHRASRALSERAEARLAELRERVEKESFQERDWPDLYRLVAECRFALVEAQREWPGNDAVGPALQRCLGLAVEIELARRDPGTARALLAELPAPDAALSARVAELERALEAERAEAERVRKLAEVADAGASPGARLAAGLLGGAGAIALSGYALWRDLTVGVSVLELVWFAIGAAAIGVTAVAIVGRELLGHAFNKRLVAWMLANLGALVANRLVGLATGAEPGAVIAHDLAVMAACFALGAMWLFPLLGVASAVLFASAVAAAVVPQAAVAIFDVATAVALVIALFAAYRARR